MLFYPAVEQWFVWIPFVTFFVYFIYVLKTKGFQHPSIPIIGLYVFCSFSSLFMNSYVLPSFNFKQYSPFYFIIFAILVLFTISPSVQINPNIILAPKINRRIKLFFYLSSFLALYSFLYQLPVAIKSINTGAYAIRSMLNVEKAITLEASWFTTIAVAISLAYIYFIILFFIAFIYKLNLFIKISMFLGSISYIVSSFAFGARDGVVFYIFASATIYLLLKNHLGEKLRKRIKIVFAAPIIIGLSILIIFTFQRFYSSGLKDKYDVIYGTLGYIGQQPYVFAERINSTIQFDDFNIRFPLYKKMIGDYQPITRTKVYEWSFGTMIADFYSGGGWLALILITLLFFIFFRFYIANQKIHLYRYIFIVGFYIQLIIQGVFYFRLGFEGGNAYILIILLTFYLLPIIYPNQRTDK